MRSKEEIELKSYSRIRKKTTELEQELDQLKKDIHCVGGMRINGLPSSQGKVKDISDYMVKLEELNNSIKSNKRKMLIIETKITLVEDVTLSDILKKRYIDEKCWSEIASDYGKSESWVKHKKNPAIVEYTKLSNIKL